MSRPTVDASAVAERYAAVVDHIATIERGFDHPVRVMAVTKGFGPDAIVAAVAAGAPCIGENYAQELLAKLETLAEDGAQIPDTTSVAFIGRLQSNKVRQLLDAVDVWASVDRPSLVKEIARRAPGARILVQVNSTGEEHKGGCPLGDTVDLVARARDAGLEVAGLLTVGPTEGGPEAARPGFERVRALVEELGLDVCSMGMSGDLDVAVAAGSTEVRVGTALFGPRR